MHKNPAWVSCYRYQIPETHLRSHARPHGLPHRSPACGLRKTIQRPPGRIQRGHPRPRRVGARARQRVRFAEAVNVVSNSDMRVAEVRQFCKLDESSESLVRAAMSQLQLSARAYHRILKLSRTIADLAGSDAIQSVHLAEALQYRPRILVS